MDVNRDIKSEGVRRVISGRYGLGRDGGDDDNDDDAELLYCCFCNPLPPPVC